MSTIPTEKIVRKGNTRNGGNSTKNTKPFWFRAAQVTRVGVPVRLGAIAAVMLSVGAAFAGVGGWLSPSRLTQDRMMAAFEDASGTHAGFRHNHAKGVCVTGWFESNGQAAGLSKAAVFKPGRIPVVGRFALAGGMPFQTDKPATVRSMALQLIKKRQVTSGFANSTFNSLNAFRFVDAAGASVPVRWSTVPVQPSAADSAEPSAPGDKNYLFDNLIAQITQHPRQWRLIVTVGQANDPTNDATLPWPDGRRQVDAGTVTIDQASSEDSGSCTAVNYDPLVLPSGIEPSDDPLLSARSAAYARSFTLRAEEEHEKPPSAVSVQEVQAGGKS